MKGIDAKSFFRVALIYAALAGTWVVLSETVLHAWGLNDVARIWWSIFKDLAFVLVTAVLLWTLLRLAWRIRTRDQAAVQKLNRALRALSECNQALVHATDEKQLLSQICRVVVEVGGYRLAWIAYAEHDEARTVRPVAQQGIEDGYLETLGLTWDDSERGKCPTCTAIRTGRPCLARHVLTDPRYAPWHAEARNRGYASSLALPLKANDEVFGSLSIYSASPDAFDTEEAKLLTELADDLAYGIAALRIRVEHEQAKAVLRESEERLRLLGDNLPDSYVFQYTIQPDNIPRFLYVSAGVERLHGVSARAVLRAASVLYNQVDPEQVIALRETQSVSLKTFCDFTMELRVRRTDGEWRWVQMDSRPRRTSGGQVVWDGVATDITARKQAEAARLAAERRLADIIEFLPDATFVVDRDKRVIAWNHACEVLTGVKAESLLGDNAYSEPFFGDRRPILIDLLDAPEPVTEAGYKHIERKDGMVYAESFVPRLRGGDGAYLWGAASPLLDREGHRCGAIEVIRDITEYKRQEAAQRESERKYLELVENANSIILHWTCDGRIIFLNEFGQRFFGYTQSEICGRHVIGTIVPETESGGRDMSPLMNRICANPSAYAQNVNENVRRNGERAWIAWTNKIALDDDGQVVDILSIGTDITELKRAQEAVRELNVTLEQRVADRTAELAVARDRAEAADRTKSAFLATMSHELRTPLNSIIGFTGLLLQGLAGPMNDEQSKQLSMVKASGQHLLALINDVLDISKIEAGQIEIANESFNLPESIRKVVQTVTPLAVRKQLPLVVLILPDVGGIVSDRRRVEQILLNLLSNAIKFTDHGDVTLTAETMPDFCRPSPREVRISVADTGLGIKPEDLQKLFQPFRQLDTGLTRQHEGTGLGLVICKRLAERLGGRIAVESTWGKGSTFSVTLPVRSKGQP